VVDVVKLRLLLPALLGLCLGGGAGAASAPARAVHALGPTSPSTRISFALNLKLDQRRLDRDAAGGTAAPATAAEIGARYGLSLGDERQVERTLAAHGVSVTATYPQRTEIDAQATVGSLGKFFGVHFRDYVDASGAVFHAPNTRPALPVALRPFVSGIVGLSSRPLALPAALPHGALRPDDAALAYDVAPLHARGIDGKGLTIAIASLEPFPPAEHDSRDDVQTFRKTFHATGPDPQDVKVDGGGAGSDLTEDELDLDIASAIAPGAQIMNYEAPKSAAGEVDVFSRIVADGKAKIASFSWGICDQGLPSAFRTAVNNALKVAILRGITVFVSSGDSGSYDCQRSDFGNHELSVDFPSDLPSVVSVGGTLLSVDSSGNYLREAGWEDPLSNAGGGGGINPDDAAPAWQVADHISTGHRVLPDVSASASSSSGWLVRDFGNWDSFGGTSAATPFWAASMLLAEQYVAKQGVGRTCFLAPILYKLALTKQPYPAFHDVRQGGNRYYPAKVGWDYATGLGSPDVWNLARDLAAYVRAHGCTA
jgi:kumamolisin